MRGREGDGRGAAQEPHAGKGSAGGRGEGTHIEHALHACDTGCVEAQRLVEGIRLLPIVIRFLPSREEVDTIRDEVRSGAERAVPAGDTGRGHAPETCNPCV